MKVCCGFWECLTYFVVEGLILLFVTLIELLGLRMSFFIVYEDFAYLCLAVGQWVGTKVLLAHDGDDFGMEVLVH
jgi:hypothetical protein